MAKVSVPLWGLFKLTVDPKEYENIFHVPLFPSPSRGYLISLAIDAVALENNAVAEFSLPNGAQ